MTDIVDLIRAEHRRILRLQETLQDLLDEGGGAASQALTGACAQFAALVARHADAEEEVCHLPMFGHDTRGLARIETAVADLNDLREALSEASLLPPGSPAWRQALRAALAACAEHCERQESELAGFQRRAGRPLREKLGRQWLAYTAAQPEDWRAG